MAKEWRSVGDYGLDESSSIKCKKCGKPIEDPKAIEVSDGSQYHVECANGDKLTLKDLDVRYQNTRKANPKVKNCSVDGCPNPRDSTPLLGMDTCCAYHRLLFDFWSADVADNILSMTRKQWRLAFDKWMKEQGKEELDKIVLRMMSEAINWSC